MRRTDAVLTAPLTPEVSSAESGARSTAQSGFTVCALALLSAVFLQKIALLGADVAFFVDKHLPTNAIVSGYNSVIPLYWSSPVYKSNGVFFLEPSFFCQFLAIAVVAELVVRPATLRLLILAAGLLCSYSGT